MFKTRKTLVIISKISFLFLLTFSLISLQYPPQAVASTDVQESNLAGQGSSGSPTKEAKEDFSTGFKGIGQGFKNGAFAAGRGLKTVGTTVSSTFQKAGSAVKGYFWGKKDVPAKQGEVSVPTVYDKDLDKVGDVTPKNEETPEETPAP